MPAQTYRPPLPAPPESAQPSADLNKRVRPPRGDATDPNFYYIRAATQEVEGSIRRLRGAAMVETLDMQLKADSIDYNEETGDVEAHGHVHFEHFVRGEKLDCDDVKYNVDDETGTFSGHVVGTSPAQVQARPGLLTTSNPYYFQSDWAERMKDHYILHHGFLTDCVVPKPWWVLRGPVFDVVPGDHAIARHSWFVLKGVPLFYAPALYKSLKKQPRKSGFLIPNIGNSTLNGRMVGFGYYWAINRSYDLTYRGQYFSEAGLAHHAELRGKLNDSTGFDLSFFGIKDQRDATDASGFRATFQGKSDLGNGWSARADVDYLSSFAFLQNFTQSFNEAVSSETHSVGFVTRHWSDYGLNFVVQRNVEFQSATEGDTVSLRKLPEASFTGREKEVDIGNWPFWVSFDTSAGLLDRDQPTFQTHQFVDRLDFAPRVSTAFRWKNIQLIPTFGIRETEYGAGMLQTGTGTGASFLRSSRDVTADLVLPSIARVFKAPGWLGEKVKHVIEPRVTYHYVTGIDDFQRVIRFDENDLITNTNQVEFSLTNRLLTKAKNGTVSDFLSWQLRWDRYFDPTFGGAVVAGQRNVIASSIDLTGYAFLNQPRDYSPVVSVVRVQSKVGIEWRADYDPLRHGLSNSSVTVDGRVNQYFWSVGHTDVKTDPILAASANQIRATIGYGNPNRRGWNYGFSMYYDYHQGLLQYWQTQVTKNTDCCGISVQYRRFSIGTRNDAQFEAAFAISNIGTFGTLKRQERMF